VSDQALTAGGDRADATATASPNQVVSDQVVPEQVAPEQVAPEQVSSGQVASQALLPSVVHDYPAAVLLIDSASGAVVYVNDLARQLAPEVHLPLAVEDWSRAAKLQVSSGTAMGASSTPLSQVVAGDPESGRQVSAALHSGASQAREALWAIGMPLHGAAEPLRARSLLVLLPLRFPEAIADVQASAAAGRAHTSVLASGLAISISDPTAVGVDGEQDPLVWVSPSFEQLTGYTSREILGRNCRFLQGPDTDPAAVARVRQGLAAGETVSQTLLNYRHDGSAFFNHLLISPVFDAEGTVIHRVSVQTDVTQQVLATRERDAARAEVAQARRQREQAEGQGRFGQLLLTMSEALTATSTVGEVAATITGVLAPALGARGGGLMLADAARAHLDFVTMAHMPEGTDAAWKRIGWEEDAPSALAVRTGRAISYRDRQTMMAAHPNIAEHADVPAMGANISLPLFAGGDVVGALFLFWDGVYDLAQQQQTALQALARYTAQAVQRATLITERRSTAEVLQQSLLTRLPEPDHLELRARYVPAASGEHVGGDWYDAVVMPDGATTVVIGDVAGHDMAAAAQMGQLRSMTRTLGYAYGEPPSLVLDRLEDVLAGLRMDTLATMILARIEQDDDDAAVGMRRLRWSNAGHPPPVLLHADATTEVLESENDLLIGLNTSFPRHDRVHPLPPGSTLLLFTDGLIEHRGRSLSDGLQDLRHVLSQSAALTLNDLLDVLERELIGEHPDDDCAVLAIRAHPEDAPRPAEAGPSTLGDTNVPLTIS